MKCRADFDKWFKNSKVAINGQPSVQFHGTSHAFNNTPFWPFTHFGTKESAEFLTEVSWELEKTATLYPVLLSIKNPLIIKDMGANDPQNLAKQLCCNGIISKKELELIRTLSEQTYTQTDCDYHNEHPDKHFDYLGYEKLVAIISAYGYDGLAYKNDVEDIDSISWVIFDNSQTYNYFDARKFGIDIYPIRAAQKIRL